MALQQYIEAFWHSDGLVSRLMLPLSRLYAGVARQRRQRALEAPPPRWPVPVIVVGNITVGGTGKTPMVIWLVEWLRAQGLRAGVVSRGYGGRAGRHDPHRVMNTDDPGEVGDEPLLIATRTNVPVVVGRARAKAVRMLLSGDACDVVVSDDGLQHYALARDIEIAMLDGRRRLGNGRCLPAGPLREPEDRLQTVDWVVVSDGAAQAGEYAMMLKLGDARRIDPSSDETRALAAFRGQTVHALAGIGNPQRFFSALEGAGLNIIRHPLPDHHRIAPSDLDFGDTRPILMTEKDAVKCRTFASKRAWAVPVDAVPDPEFVDALSERLRSV
ncbi:tetraacyldisaccharide 4'-kinase [Acidihalobacter prosperus]|uniref:Tetraacyldisaccharide 4'-kinase n=1 Tax=Acidihalobacter prosperus TaxID=160660 RepID=A0A1A6C8J0_9GAMM|nr:tetraacyldisaccharide 4'-kinase [Acidihalobacter prosperus]OBS10865.1 Tetraacyldisaccharide 4'-kinase [Acidihalobacter prosperus]